MSWYPCCAAVGECGCAGDAATGYSVTPQNWTDNGTCEGCDEFCGSHALSFLGSCTWGVGPTSSGDPCGGIYSISLHISDSAGNTQVTIQITYGDWTDPSYIYYGKVFSGHVDCTAWVNEPIPFLSRVDGADVCDYGITEDPILLTAL